MLLTSLLQALFLGTNQHPLDVVFRVKRYLLGRCAWRDPKEIPLFLPKSVAPIDLVHPFH